MIEHNNPAEATEIAVDRDRLREQLFKAVHPLTSKWGWFPAEKHAGDIADAALAVVQPVLERQADAVETSGDPDVKVTADRWWRDDAPMSGSDTTADGGQS